MKLLIGTTLLLTFILASCDDSITNRRKLSKADLLLEKVRVSQSCKNAIVNDENKCLNDACDKWNCNDGTYKSLCNSVWDGMCCITGLVKDKCSADDQTSLRDQYSITQNQLEANQCKSYPRSSIQCKNSSTKLLQSSLIITSIIGLVLIFK
jgi:hypothetical protein